LEQAIKAYADHLNSHAHEVEHVKKYVKDLKEGLQKVKAQHAKINRAAHRNAGISLGLGFLGCVA